MAFVFVSFLINPLYICEFRYSTTTSNILILCSYNIFRNIQMKGGEHPSLAMYYLAAGTTGTAGILHLIVASNVMGFSVYYGAFFIVAGIVQMLWIFPMIKQ
jgi:hypothetical protein